MSLAPERTLYGTRLVSSCTSLRRRPMKRLIEKTVFWGLVTACRLATWPTSRSPSLVKPTTEGVVRPPSAFGMTTGSPPSITATTELVVPRSIPITLSAIADFSWLEPVRPSHFDPAVKPGAYSAHLLLGKPRAAFFCHNGVFVRLYRLLSRSTCPTGGHLPSWRA